jgi:heptosyltransferase-2
LPGFVELTQRFLEEGWRVVLLGNDEERALGEQIEKSLAQHANREHLLNHMGQHDLLQTLRVLSHARLAISNDSGGQHLASVAGVPVVSIFGPTVLEIGFRPWNAQSRVVQVKDLNCRPCGKHGHKVCPIGTHVCMKSLSVEEVWQAGQSILRPAPSH